MIGLVVRSLVGAPVGLCGSIIAPLVTICAVCGLLQLCRCKIRDCSWCKRCLRMSGTDTFDDFEMIIIVHQATYTTHKKHSTYVKIHAGDHAVQTDPSNNGVYQQAVSLFVEQGTEDVKLELVSASDKVLGELRLNVLRDVLSGSAPSERLFPMRQRNKHVLNPRIRLTLSPGQPGAEDRALLDGMHASAETELMLQQQLAKATGAQEEHSEIALIAKGCSGPLEAFGALGRKRAVHVGVLGPPERKRFALHFWESQEKCEAGEQALHEIELLRVSSVVPDPQRPAIFHINYVKKDGRPHRRIFQRVDRSRDVWVELLQMLVTRVHEQHREKKTKGVRPAALTMP
mmetsp:Transcript_71233/g.201884  ORF Transcript_71233/g.201884 Transcript_71233/m.201884 type:complete len:345 (-) Transcript_71233:77-1111(-)